MSEIITSCLMSTTKRTFPPLYRPTGNADTDRLAFFHVLERLKVPTSIAIRTLTHPRRHRNAQAGLNTM